MTKFIWKFLSLTCICAVFMAIGATDTSAFSTYEGGCVTCHPGFQGGPAGPLHGDHTSLTSDCFSCHLIVGDDPRLGYTPTSDTGTGCVGCHGRIEDAGNDSVPGGLGAGLRQHHDNAGISCLPCHSDSVVGDYIPVGEAVVPLFYPFLIPLALDPCDDLLDNDGQLLYDGEDPDCAVPECTVDADCDDGMFCNGAETCDTATGTCQAGTPVDCDDGVACTVDTCDEVNDACVNTPDDASCDDGNVCNGSETCDPVNDCQPGTALDCDDENLCTTDSCDPLTGCANVPVECPAGEQCDPADGECKLPPECTVDADCDDGMFCNGAETCDTATGTCQAGTPVDCDDGVACTVDTCDEVNDACVNTPDDTACPDDGLFCTGQEICDPAAGCVSTGDPCPEGMTCNEDTDTCDVVSGKVTICHIPPGNPAKARTLSINARSVADHLAHGDLLGPCP